MDLTPDAPPIAGAPAPARPRHRWRAALAATVVLAALGAVVANGLGSATLYFRTVDEAVADADGLGDRRFRLKGDVVDGTVAQTADGVTFDLTDGGQVIAVTHLGDPPELFQPGIPVVLEGRLVDDAAGGHRFESDRIMVKHSNEYEADHPDRVAADDR